MLLLSNSPNRWNDEAQPHGEERSSLLDGDTEHDYDGNDEGLDELSELGRGGVDEESQWSESSPTRSEFSPKPPRQQVERGHSGFAGMSSVPDNVGSASVASWDARSEPTLGTDGGTDQDIAAASGLPEDESEDSDDEEDDDFEVADSLDLGAVALCVSFEVLYVWLPGTKCGILPVEHLGTSSIFLVFW